MRHWSQLGIRNWRAKPGRTAGGLAAIALGVGVVVWVTCAYESVRLALQDQVWLWTGRSHLSIESPSGPEGTVNQRLSVEVRRLSNVAHVTEQLRFRALCQRHDPTGTQPAGKPVTREITAIGIDPATEPYFRQYDASRVTGRVIQPSDRGAAMMEFDLAIDLNLKIGDTFYVVDKMPNFNTGHPRYAAFKIVGLIEHRRVAKQQLPVIVTTLTEVQQLAGYDAEPRKVSKIDVILKDASITAIQSAERQLRALASPNMVTSAEAKMRQVHAAEQQTSFVLLLISTVALFTAFFVILSTLSMGLVERIGQLGTLRCLGTTRLQLASIVMAEAAPIGLAGIVLGIPVGFGLARLSVWLAPQYIGQFAISPLGLVAALVGGALTTLIGTLMPMVQAMRISPLAASRPQARPPSSMVIWIAGALGAGMVAYHTHLVLNTTPTRWFEPPTAQRPFSGPVLAVTAVTLLYGGYALVTPALVRLIGSVAVWIAATILRIRPRLLSDQVGRAAWRSGAICCGLMVGLSLIVSLVVHSRSLAAGWDFPKNFCEAFVHVAPPVLGTQAETGRKIPGVGSSALINVSTQCNVLGKSLFQFPWSRFVTGDPEEFFNIANLEFLKGSKKEAIEKLSKGGYILVTPEFVRSQGIDYGQKVRVMIGGNYQRTQIFEIAGVVTSPALDIAANYFNAGGMLASQSAHVLLGTQADLRRIMGTPEQVSMFLINFDLPDTPAPAEFAQKEGPWQVWDPERYHELLKRWAPFMPERSAEMARIEREFDLLGTALPVAERKSSVAPMKAPVVETRGNLRPATPARQESDAPAVAPTAIPRDSGDAAAATQPSVAPAPKPTPSYLLLPTLDLFKQALGNRVFPEWGKLTPDQRWRIFREELVLRLVPRKAGAMDEQHASVRALKIQIDRDLSRATMIFTTIPMVALIVAALGVGNLMTANVTSRTRQIAMLRAIGATKWQITRLIIGEAIVLGAIGSALGLALGLHAATGMNHMTQAIWGFKPNWTIPWMWVACGVGFTVGVCLIAGIIPARHASRNNIIDALQTT